LEYRGIWNSISNNSLQGEDKKSKKKKNDPILPRILAAKNSIVVLINITISYVFSDLNCASNHKSSVEMFVFEGEKPRSS